MQAVEAQRWEQGSYEVWLLRGGCSLRQDTQAVTGRQAVLWVHRTDPLGETPHKIIAYVEGDVAVSHGRDGPPHRGTGAAADTVRDQCWLGRFYTIADITIAAPVAGPPPSAPPPLFQRAVAARDHEFDSAVQPAQFSGPLPGYQLGPPPGAWAWPPPPQPPRPMGPRRLTTPNPMVWPAASDPAGAGPVPVREAPPGRGAGPRWTPAGHARPAARSVVIRSPGNVRMDGKVFPSPDGSETIAVVTNGVKIVVDGIENLQGLKGGKLDIEADRVVLWTTRLDALDLSQESSGEKLQPHDAPLEVYLEGNIVFLEGDRVVYAERMYYNIRQRYGIILNAEALAPAPGYQGLVRLKANVLQQLDEYRFRAYGAALTTSRLGVPRYWLQAENVNFEHVQTEQFDPLTGASAIDPETGRPAVDHQFLATSRNNFLYVAGVPLLYWPTMATDLQKPSFYVDSLRIRSDGVLGWQVVPEVDMLQLLGFPKRSEGVRWTLSPTYMSKRGPGLGTDLDYERPDFFGIPGPVRGTLDAWGLKDSGVDRLGRDRLAVLPEEEWRGRVHWQHRQVLANGFQFTGEAGWISDRNFLEQYFEREWDEQKDQTTGVELKQFLGSSTWSVSADVRLNDFFTQTEWLPRLDHHVLGYSLFDRVTWSAHSHIGYARLRTAALPGAGTGEPVPAPLAWELDPFGPPGTAYDNRTGIRAATRQELALPLPVGPCKVTPYILGEAAFWAEDMTGQDTTRLYGQAGVRGSVPFWKVYPNVQSTLFNLNGLAHKAVVEADFSWGEADVDMTSLPLYDSLDDDATEHFRRRFLAGLYGGTLPAKFDERYYAFRTGLQDWVTASSTEIVDDLMRLRLDLHQRWQTKRGAPDQQRVVDWIVLDMGATWFPKPDRDNFGEDFGLLDYNFRWNIGERFALLSDGFVDLFDDGLRTFSIGGRLTRPLRGSLYLGFRAIDGPFSSRVLTAELNYRMSEKWIANAAAAIDLGDTGGIGENVSVVRIGESALIRFGFHVDHSRDTWGFNFGIEPRFLPGRLARVGGVPLPPAGAFGLE